MHEIVVHANFWGVRDWMCPMAKILGAQAPRDTQDDRYGSIMCCVLLASGNQLPLLLRL